MIDIFDLSKEMSETYKEDTLKWTIMLRRLIHHGYGIYKMPNYQRKQVQESLDDSDFVQRCINTWKDIAKETTTDTLSCICRDDVTLYLTCPRCGEKIEPDKKGRIINYKGTAYCYKCALQVISEWKRSSYDKSRSN